MNYKFKIEKNGYHYIAISDNFPLIYALTKKGVKRKAKNTVLKKHKKVYNYSKHDLSFYTWEEKGKWSIVEHHQITFQ